MSKILRILIFSSIISILPLNNLYCQLGEFGFGAHYTGTQDFIEVSYGLGKLKHKSLTTTFNDLSQNEIIIGRRYLKPAANYKLISFSDNYLFSSYINDYQSANNEDFKLSINMWKVGLGYRSGYGYKLGNMAIMPYYHFGLVWNNIDLKLPKVDNPFISNDEIAYLKNYEDQIKFGTSNIGGLDLKLSSVVGIGASYSMDVIFPYHKFWKQTGSFFIETFAQTGIDFFMEGVMMKAAPGIVPIFNFIAKNGLSYYLFTKKKEKMNWPFESIAPLTQETFKVSLKITL